MTHKATMNWSGNYTYRGYTINKNGRVWDIYDNASYKNTENCSFKYAWTLSEAKKKIDAMIGDKHHRGFDNMA